MFNFLTIKQQNSKYTYTSDPSKDYSDIMSLKTNMNNVSFLKYAGLRRRRDALFSFL